MENAISVPKVLNKKTQSKKGLSFYAINQPKNYKL